LSYRSTESMNRLPGSQTPRPHGRGVLLILDSLPGRKTKCTIIPTLEEKTQRHPAT
jgi:hypothetical protein